MRVYSNLPQSWKIKAAPHPHMQNATIFPRLLELLETMFIAFE